MFDEMSQKLYIEFVPCLDFDMIRKLANFFMVLDDSCKILYQEKDFAKIAVSGRNRKGGCIFVKTSNIPSKQVVTHFKSQYNAHSSIKNTTRRATG